MYKLEYYSGNKLIESYNFPNKNLCYWKKNQLLNQGRHNLGTFKIKKV